MRKPFNTLFSVAFCLALINGCGGADDSNRPTRVKTSGTVTHKGQPVEGATVLFAPAEGQGHAATGLTDSQGRFRLTTFLANDGAVPGNYKVTISKFDMSTANPDLEDDLAIEMRQDSDKIVGPTPLLPIEFSEIETTPLIKEVTTGAANEFQFDL